MREYKLRISAVYLFKNGLVAVFDQYGHQMGKFQGRKAEAMPKIKRRLARQEGLVEWREEKWKDGIYDLHLLTEIDTV